MGVGTCRSRSKWLRSISLDMQSKLSWQPQGRRAAMCWWASCVFMCHGNVSLEAWILQNDVKFATLVTAARLTRIHHTFQSLRCEPYTASTYHAFPPRDTHWSEWTQDIILHRKFSSNIVQIARPTLTASIVRTRMLKGTVEGLVYTWQSISAAAKSDVQHLSLRHTMMSACSPSRARCSVVKNASLTPAFCRRLDAAKFSQA